MSRTISIRKSVQIVAITLLIALLGVLGLWVARPFRSLERQHFDSLTLWVEGYPAQYTTFDPQQVDQIKRIIARSSPWYIFDTLWTSLTGRRPVLLPPLEASNSHSRFRLAFSAGPFVRGTFYPQPPDAATIISIVYDPPWLIPLRAARVTVGGRSTYAPPSLFAALLPLMVGYQGQTYGELVSWETGNSLFPVFSIAAVTDLETGRRYFVQRRAGRNHADVQPLTAADTTIMKEIFGGSWSWQPRAVLVTVGEHTFAGSVNGMPHGAGRIGVNNFPGHSCLYFLGSRTHATGSVDRNHLLQVLRAAGVRVTDAQSSRTEDTFTVDDD